jgi:hypothetical protein
MNAMFSRIKIVNCSFCLAALLFLFGPVTNVFSFGTGHFQGIIESDSNNDESFGFIGLTLSANGTFSLKFNLGVNQVGQHIYIKSGKFNQSGHYHFEGPDPHDTRYAVARIIDLQLDSIDSPTRITGDMTDLTHSSTVRMERVAVATLANAAPEAGAYTFAFSSTDSGLVHGPGVGRVVITRLGHLVASGRTPDGRIFSQTANVTVYDNWPVFAKAQGNTNGILSGWLNFQETADSDFSGELTWLGPEVPGPNHAFVPAFSGTVSTVGSRYIQHSGPVLNINSSLNNVGMTFSGGNLNDPIVRNLTLSSANVFTFSPKFAGDSLVVNPYTGVFNGTFKHSDGRIYPLRGVILQKSNQGVGHFVPRGGNSGTVTLDPK